MTLPLQAVQGMDSVQNNFDTVAQTFPINPRDISDSAVTTAAIATNAVTTVKITDANVTTAKIADGAITSAKMADRLVAALPTAVDGAEIYYKADSTNGVIWHLRARSVVNGGSATYPWEYVGGPPIASAINVNQRLLTNQTAYTNFPTDQVTLTIPLAGDYDITGSVYMLLTAGTGILPAVWWSYTTNAAGTNASDTWGLVNTVGGGVLGGGSFTSTVRQTGLAASTVLREKGRTVGNWNIYAQYRSLMAVPVRVG